MLIKSKKSYEINESEVTPEHLYLNRRSFMRGAAGVAGAMALAACRPARPGSEGSSSAPAATSGGDQAAPQGSAPSTGTEANAVDQLISATTDELGDPINDLQDIITFNNYYEFTTDKRDVQKLSEGYVTSPWQIEIGGHVNKPGVYDVADILKNFDQEERIYRMRCVEAWSMVIPWNGFSLSKLLELVEPTAKGKYVAFQTILDPENMPGQNSIFGGYDWPYKEGLRIDEAMNPLTTVATGIYGNDLLPQNGAPIRIVVPWKYGFKSIKSIVKIELVEEQPVTLWNTANGSEYGFYSNVNPEVSHPRWTQSTERRIGESGRRPTLMFNGYEEQVAHLYKDMNLKLSF